MAEETWLIFALGATIGSAVMAASYQNRHVVDRQFFIRILGNFFAHGIVILIGVSGLYVVGTQAANFVRSMMSIGPSGF